MQQAQEEQRHAIESDCPPSSSGTKSIIPDERQARLENRIESVESAMLEMNVFLARLSSELFALKSTSPSPRRGTPPPPPLSDQPSPSHQEIGKIRAKQHPDAQQETIIESYTFHQSPEKTLSSSSTSSSSSDLTFSKSPSPPAKIPFYRGERDAETIWSWLQRVESYFRVGQAADDEKIFIATYHFRDSAYFWWRKRSINPPVTWEEFVRLFVPTFVPPNHLRETRFALMDLRQSESVKEYSGRFTRLVNRLPQLCEDDKVAYFVHGLRCSLREFVDEHNPRSLQEAVRVAEIAENRKFGW